MKVYLDSSAAAKLLARERESAALAEHLRALADAEFTSSTLLETELRRTATRIGVDQSRVSAVLARIELVDPRRSLFGEAGRLPGTHLRSLDALHLATALRIEADVMVGYDTRLLEAAHELGLATASPS